MKSGRSCVARYILFWPVLAVAAIANGILREYTYGAWTSELAAHQISTLSAIVLTGSLAGLCAQRWPLDSCGDAWLIGVCWLALTVAFEFGFGHYVAGHSWDRLVADYDLSAGRVWPLFLVWVCVMPVVFRRPQRSAR